MRVWATVHWLIIAGIIVVSLINASWIAPVQRGALDLIAAGSARGAAANAQCDSSTIFGAVDRMFLDRADRVVVSVRRAGDEFRIVLPKITSCIEDASAPPRPNALPANILGAALSLISAGMAAPLMRSPKGLPPPVKLSTPVRP